MPGSFYIKIADLSSKDRDKLVGIVIMSSPKGLKGWGTVTIDGKEFSVFLELTPK